MKCNKAKALIMEYIDDELNPKLSQDLHRHLESCPSCKRLEQTLRQVIISPLRQTEQLKAPDKIWYGLREAIVNRRQRRLLPDFIGSWFNYFQINRLVLAPAAATIVIILLFSVLFFKTSTTQDTLSAYLEQQIQFISQLAENGRESYLGIDEVSLETTIERYLL